MKKMPRKQPEPITTAEITRPLKIGHVNCSDEWGVWGCWKYSDAQYPILKCKSFTFYNMKLRQKENCKQWNLFLLMCCFILSLLNKRMKFK